MIRSMFLAAALALAPALPALATSQDDVLSAEFLPGWRTPDGNRIAALQLTLAPHWKTYWRAPGEAGIPPYFDWSASENLKSVRLHWPAPTVFHLNGMQSVGYFDSLILPIELTPIDPAQPVILRARIDLGVCNEICMPAALALEKRLSGAGAPDAAIKAALGQRPATPREAGVTAIRCEVAPSQDGMQVTAQITLPAPRGDETVVFEPGLPDIWVADSTSRRQGGQLTATTEMVAPSGSAFALDRSALTLTVIADGKAVEISGCPAN